MISRKMFEDWIDAERQKEVVPNRYYVPVDWRESAYYRELVKSIVGDEAYLQLLAEPEKT